MDMDFEVNMNEYLPLRDVVFNTLRKAILRGELKPGERLMEIQLANKLGVSRTPIREAIRKLELEGLVLMIPRKGAEVAQITEKNMQDVLEVRKALEELSVQLACERITPEQVEEMKMAAEDFRKVLKSGDVTKIAEADVKFHDIIFAATNNQRPVSYTHLDVYKRQVLFMLIGMIAHPVFSAILSAPSRNGSIESSSPLLRVPSGKMQMEMPFFT